MEIGTGFITVGRMNIGFGSCMLDTIFPTVSQIKETRVVVHRRSPAMLLWLWALLMTYNEQV